MSDALDRMITAFFAPIIQPIMERLDNMADKLTNLTNAVNLLTTAIGATSAEMHTLADAVVAGHAEDDTEAVNTAADQIKALAAGLDTLVTNVQTQIAPAPAPAPTPSPAPASSDPSPSSTG